MKPSAYSCPPAPGLWCDAPGKVYFCEATSVGVGTSRGASWQGAK
jgi:hypothetical protein